MNIYISDAASNWYKKEMSLDQGANIRFFVRYGGNCTIHPGFSLGISNEDPIDAGVEAIKDGIRYFIEEDDLWYFEGKNLKVEFNERLNEPEFKIG